MTCTPVRIRNRTYPSIKAAAEALNLHPSTVSKALDRGTVDYCGLGKAFHPTHRPRGKPPIPYTIGRTIFPSKAAACRALGKSETYLNTINRSPKSRANYLALVREFERKELARIKRRAYRAKLKGASNGNV